MLAAENQAQRDREVAKEINKTPQRKGLPTLKFSSDLKVKINKPDQEDKSASNANEERTGLFNSAKLMANWKRVNPKVGFQKTTRRPLWEIET